MNIIKVIETLRRKAVKKIAYIALILIIVADFFKLSEAGNLRVDIRKRLILGLLISDKIRPSIKFLFLENLEMLPLGVRRDVINEAINSPDKPNLEAIKQELLWLKLELPPERVH